jgi:hypothetical protein
LAEQVAAMRRARFGSMKDQMKDQSKFQPYAVYQRARGEATSHLQVNLLAVESEFRTPGDAGVDAEVVRIFVLWTTRSRQ